MTQLRECPFCGGEAYQEQIGNSYTNKRGFDVGCHKCRVTISDRTLRASMEQIKIANAQNWNKRASITVDISSLPALRAAVNAACVKAIAEKEIFGEIAVNWMSLYCASVGLEVRENGNWVYRILIEEAAPDAFRLQSYIIDELCGIGWGNFELNTEW